MYVPSVVSLVAVSVMSFLFFFNDTATTEIYTLSLHDALPICGLRGRGDDGVEGFERRGGQLLHVADIDLSATHLLDDFRSEEHTSELQSLAYLVCRLLLEKKKKSRTR